MSLLSRLFALGRVRRAPAAHNAGRLLPPASVQRTHLGLRHVELPSGVVTLRSGEVRAILSVSGIPLHHRSTEAARIFLTGWANALNAMPPTVAWLTRSRPGGLARVIRAKRDQAAALAAKQPGTGLARLAADQLAHAHQLHARGVTRKTDSYLAVRDAKGDVRALLQAVETIRARFREAGLRVELLKDRALAQAIAESWQPAAIEHWWVDFTGPDGDVSLVYSPGAARVTTPRYLDGPPEPRWEPDRDPAPVPPAGLRNDAGQLAAPSPTGLHRLNGTGKTSIRSGRKGLPR